MAAARLFVIGSVSADSLSSPSSLYDELRTQKYHKRKLKCVKHKRYAVTSWNKYKLFIRTLQDSNQSIRNIWFHLSEVRLPYSLKSSLNDIRCGIQIYIIIKSFKQLLFNQSQKQMSGQEVTDEISKRNPQNLKIFVNIRSIIKQQTNVGAHYHIERRRKTDEKITVIIISTVHVTVILTNER